MPIGVYPHDKIRGENHGRWKGVDASYAVKHQYVARHLKKEKCQKCGETSSTKLEYANISGEYLRELSDWIVLCQICHYTFDNHSEATHLAALNRTNCKNGHAYDMYGYYSSGKKGNKYPQRRCKQCQHLAYKRHYAKKNKIPQ